MNIKRIIASDHAQATLCVGSRRKRPLGNGWIFQLTDGRQITVITAIREGATLLERAELRPTGVLGEFDVDATRPILFRGPMLHLDHIILHTKETILASLTPKIGERERPHRARLAF